MSSNLLLPSNGSMLRRAPVKKLSRQMISAPCDNKRSHKCEPRKPEPPVTKIRCCKCMMLFALPDHRDRDFHFQPNLAHRKTIRCGWPGILPFSARLTLPPIPPPVSLSRKRISAFSKADWIRMGPKHSPWPGRLGFRSDGWWRARAWRLSRRPAPDQIPLIRTFDPEFFGSRLPAQRTLPRIYKTDLSGRPALSLHSLPPDFTGVSWF